MRRHRKRRFGASDSTHAERARGDLREIRELTKIARDNIDAGDCVRATSALVALATAEGAYVVNRSDSGGKKSPAGLPSDRLYSRFTRACIRPSISTRRSYGGRR